MADLAVDPDGTVDAKVLLGVLARLKAGDFSARMPFDWTGVAGKVADGLNDVIAGNQAFAAELERVSRVVGKEGRLSQRLVLGGWTQSWSGSVESVNNLIEELVRPTSEMQRVIGAVADGDLSKKVSAEVQGEMLELKNTINAMVDQLNRFISEVTRVAREVGTEGRLGQAAAVTIEVGGVWKDLTDNVNLMAGNLTGQVRNIAEVTTAVANGDLSKKISIDVKGEFLELKNTVNAMVDQLNAFAGEVTRVAREVGIEGKLGGQAKTKEIGGVWKDLTDNVNLLAANLTNQVRAISEVAAAVTEGDLTRQVRVEASGEVAVLKDKLNEMIRNLRETTRQNVEQDWLKTNRERFTRMLQGQRDLATVSSMILSELAPLVSAQHGVFYAMTAPADGREAALELQAGYGYRERKQLSTMFRLGEGLVGQCAKEKERILLTEVPSDYVRISSGLGAAPPLNIIVLPVLFEGSVRAVIELASFSAFSSTHQAFLDQITESIGLVLSTIDANTLTENLLEQSQSLAQELRLQQEELRASNEDLGRQARLLAARNLEAEQKNAEVEDSKRLAGQLAVSSKYKSEFIASMSHELRTPLNSLLILAELLAGNPGDNMTASQVQYASVILASGQDLLRLLNDILDLAKVESGTVTIEMGDLSMHTLRATLLRDFEHVALGKGLAFSVDLADNSPGEIFTDPERLGQVLKNLLANAFKFTEEGSVKVDIGVAQRGWSALGSLGAAPAVVAIAVSDSGIGIEERQQERIFEPFVQVDGTASRPKGGTGLGLSISRELIDLLGGEIAVTSTPGLGSTFTVYLPVGPARSGSRAGPSPARSTPPPRGPSTPPVASEWGSAGPRLAASEGGSLTAAGEWGSAGPRLAASEGGSLTAAGERGSAGAPAAVPEAGPPPAVPEAGAPPAVPEPGSLALARERGAPPTGLVPTPARRGLGGVDDRFAGHKVLVVDDDFRNTYALRALLERGYAEVTTADCGPDAIALLQRTPDIDIVLMDIMMPVMDGYETIRRIRALGQFDTLPIVAVTAKVMAGERERCLDAGASAYVPKPIDSVELLAALRPWLRPSPESGR